MSEDERHCRRHGKKPDAPRDGASSLMGPPGGGPLSSHSQSERAVFSLLSIPPKSMQDFYMLLSDVHKAFSDVGKLTSGDT
jgi:hypothetical protein